MTKQKPNFPQILRRAEALALAALTLWGVSVTAGSRSFSDACDALGHALALPALRWELGGLPAQSDLSAPAATALAQSPLLLSARGAVAQLHGTESADETKPSEPSPQIVENSVEIVDISPKIPDNGVLARTLIPTDPSGYTVWGKVWISSSRDTPLTEADQLSPAFSPVSPASDGPQVLIVHTHGSEAYTPVPGTEVLWSGDHRSTDVRYSVIHVGDVVADVLSEAGLSVLHDRTLYDYPSYPGSYERSLSAVERQLEAHPSIRFILDIHRDAIEDKAGNQYKAVAQADGDVAAQMSLVVGSDGSGLEHPGWRENLAFAAALQTRVLDRCPQLMRPILLRKSRYNQHMSPQSLLLEVGAAGNSPQEAERSARIFAQEYAKLLLGE